MKKEKNKDVTISALLRHIVPKAIGISPVYFVFMTAVAIAHGLFWGIDILIRQEFFDAAAGLPSGQTMLRGVLLAFAALALCAVLTQFLNGLSNYMFEVYSERIVQKLRFDINARIQKLSPELFENTETLDDINKAEKGAGAALQLFFVIYILLTFYLPYFIFVGWYLFSLKPLFLLSIVIVFIPTALTQLIRAKVFAKLEDDSAPKRREFEYYEKAIADREYFKETRLLGAFGYFKEKFVETYRLCLKLRMRAEIRSTVFELSMNILTILGYFAILYLLFSALMAGEISVGAFAAVFANIGMLYEIMSEVVNRHIGSLAQNFGATVNYVRFHHMPERSGEVKTAPDWGDITFRDVSYSYPHAERPAISHVSFTLHRGETLAVVGENGSGKSTLIRLLSGLYLPSEGEVLVNGVSTQRIDPPALFGRTSAVFQKYQRYQMTLRENLTISDPGKQTDNAQLDEICQMAGCNPADSSFTDGYDTMLSREFDGVDLSGGQWQRIAIARGFYRDHDLIILDEPTAAIDPYEEMRVYNRFAELSRDKSAIIVTHRIGSVRLADRILVMQDGQGVQLGTHEELMREEGEYRRLWESQEQWYRENPGDETIHPAIV
ncbi:MAG: ABC transporter ATP-binding protein [Clostridiaceae bacterium]|nr:ABC transporter ATP-binding protein [Clostridiaceae bacterium]